MAPRWQSVVFDLDGTLCDTIALILASFRHAWDEVLHQELDETVARGWIGSTLTDTFAPHGALAQQLNDSYVRYNLENLERLQASYPGVAELLDDLGAAGVATGIATSKRRTTAERSLAAAGLTGRVVLAATMDETTRHKPDPAPLLKALEVMGVEAGHAVYVGDARVDMQAARAAGMDAVGVTWGAGTREALLAEDPTAVVDTVDELHRVLLGA